MVEPSRPQTNQDQGLEHCYYGFSPLHHSLLRHHHLPHPPALRSFRYVTGDGCDCLCLKMECRLI